MTKEKKRAILHNYTMHFNTIVYFVIVQTSPWEKRILHML